jgi:membrane protease YdiL (CAAX protease family)
MADSQTTGNLAMMTSLLLGSLAAWTWIVFRWKQGLAPIEWQAREPCPWHPVVVGLALPVSIVVQVIALRSAPDINPASVSHLRSLCLALVLEMLVLMGLLAIWTPIRAEDFGLHRTQLAENARFGLLGFLAAILPVYAVSYAVEAGGLRDEGAKHSFLQLLDKHPGPETIFWIVLAAVVLAPMAEELLFRVILQGWLETRVSPRVAIGFVSILFASVHYEPGRPDHLPLFPLALILGYLYYRRHSYLAVVVLHGIFNALNVALALLFSEK